MNFKKQEEGSFQIILDKAVCEESEKKQFFSKDKNIWEMTRNEWMSCPREWKHGIPQTIPLNLWRSQNGYANPLDDHGDFKRPHGISKAEKRRIHSRFKQRIDSMLEGSKEYEKLRKEGNLPIVQKTFTMKADGMDQDNVLSAARAYHKRMVKKALYDGCPVPDRVVEDYPQFLEIKRISRKIWKLTVQEFLSILDNATPQMVKISTPGDWVKPVNQGRRSKNNTSAFLDLEKLNGCSEYIPNYAEWKNNERNIRRIKGNWFLYSQAREIGMDHLDAGKLAVINDPNKFHKRIVKDALYRGENVPEVVLIDYPDLIKSKTVDFDLELEIER